MRTGIIDLDGIKVKVKVLRERLCYGRTDFEIEPLNGGNSGKIWVQDRRVKLDKEE